MSATDGEGNTVNASALLPSFIANVSHAPTGIVTITGTAAEGQVLSADTSSLADEDGLGEFSYRWLRDGVEIDGATSETYTLSQVDIGSVITATVTYTDGEGTVETVTSAATSAVANVNDAPTGEVTISGTATEDQILTASNTLADEDGLGTLSYQWNRDGVAIDGATSETYTLVQADVGKTITATVSYTDGYGTEESVTSVATSAVENVSFATTGGITISGTAAEGEVLTAVSTLADKDGLGDLSYQWNRDGVAIDGATSETYTLTQADVGKTITATVSYTDGEGTVESVTSAATSAVENVSFATTGGITISGTAAEGEVLTAVSTLADKDGLGPLSYQWSRAGSAISGATSEMYTLTADDVSSTISVAVFYTDGEGTQEAVISSATSLVEPIVPSSLLITENGLDVGTALTGAIAAGEFAFVDKSNVEYLNGFQESLGTNWLVDGVLRYSSPTPNYIFGPVLRQADVGKFLTVEYKYLNGLGNEETIVSDNYLINGPNEFVVNTYTNNSQYSPSVTSLSDGGFVVTWQSNGQDGSVSGIYGQRFAANGLRIGSEFRVNTSDPSTANDAYSSVTVLTDGGWVVTWLQISGDDGRGVYGQRYGADGEAVGDKFRVSESNYGAPQVIGLSDGGWIVVSEGNDIFEFGVGGAPRTGIYTQRYDPDGLQIGDELHVNTYWVDYQEAPSIAGLSDGG